MATLDTTKDETVATEDPSEEAKAEQSASNFESQDTSSRDVPQVDENVENPEEIQAPSSPPDTEPLQGTALKKPTFMRVAREHISPEVLDKHSIPYIDDPVRDLVLYSIPLTPLGSLFFTYHAMASRGTTRAILDGIVCRRRF